MAVQRWFLKGLRHDHDLSRKAVAGSHRGSSHAAVLGGEGPITVEGSRLALVMPTNEELVIARDALSLVG